MKKIISKYKNGNYNVVMFEDGTKIRFNNKDKLIPDFPESMDMKITNCCPYGCKICHERSTPDGQHGDILNNPFIDTLHAGTELAIGGGAVTSHPDLVPFLKKLRKNGIFPSITVNQREWNDDLIKMLFSENLVCGIGLSYAVFDTLFFDKIRVLPNLVVHLIAGYHDKKIFEYFAEKGFKILILGYKHWGRGEDYAKEHEEEIQNKIKDVREMLPELFKKCKVVSFDNLSIEQLKVREIIGEEKWKEFYMGNDGQYTMYVDMVKQECAKSSTSPDRRPLSEFNNLWNETKVKE